MTKSFQEKIRVIVYSDPKVLSGTQCFIDTRVPVSLVLDYLSLGWPTAEISKAFPTVKTEYIAILLKLYSEEFDQMNAKAR